MCVSRSPLTGQKDLRGLLSQGQAEVDPLPKCLAVEGDNKKRDLGLLLRK